MTRLPPLEFLQLVASEANDVCSKENKTLIGADHVLLALQNLGFTEYMAEITAYHAKLKKESTERTERTKANANASGMTDAELYEQQQALFEPSS